MHIYKATMVFSSKNLKDTYYKSINDLEQMIDQALDDIDLFLSYL